MIHSAPIVRVVHVVVVHQREPRQEDQTPQERLGPFGIAENVRSRERLILYREALLRPEPLPAEVAGLLRRARLRRIPGKRRLLGLNARTNQA